MIKGEEKIAFRDNISKLMFFVFVAIVVLLGRLIWLQVIDKTTLDTKNLDQVETSRKLQSPRGTIYDRNGNPLAMSMVTRSLYRIQR